MCILQAKAAALQDPEPPQPYESLGQPLPAGIYETIDHFHAKPDSPHQHQLARDNSYVNAPEPHYIVPPKNINQADNMYESLMFPLNQITGVSNSDYEEIPASPPPAYSPYYNEPSNY
jgi:hypothetical protein